VSFLQVSQGRAAPWSVLDAAVVACVLFAGEVAGKGHLVKVSLQVSARGLNLSKPAGARESYSRLKNAAWIVCTDANRLDLETSADPSACSEKAFGQAIRSANVPLLTQAYLQTHLPRDAAIYGLEVPVMIAAKRGRPPSQTSTLGDAHLTTNAPTECSGLNVDDFLRKQPKGELR
jgi:UrcA family protein